MGALAENDADGFDVGRALAPGNETVGKDLARGGNENSGQHFDGSGFPGAVGADVADHVASADGERNVVHGLHDPVFAVEEIDEAANDAFPPLESAEVLGERTNGNQRVSAHEQRILVPFQLFGASSFLASSAIDLHVHCLLFGLFSWNGTSIWTQETTQRE